MLANSENSYSVISSLSAPGSLPSQVLGEVQDGDLAYCFPPAARKGSGISSWGTPAALQVKGLFLVAGSDSCLLGKGGKSLQVLSI